MMFAYLYGITYDIEPYAHFLKSKGIEIIEDCAQSWRGLDAFRGSEHAILTMFSFGTIKYNSALFGSVSIVREKEPLPGQTEILVDKMKQIQSNYVQLPLKEYISKIQKAFLLKQLI